MYDITAFLTPQVIAIAPHGLIFFALAMVAPSWRWLGVLIVFWVATLTLISLNIPPARGTDSIGDTLVQMELVAIAASVSVWGALGILSKSMALIVGRNFKNEKRLVPILQFVPLIGAITVSFLHDQFENRMPNFACKSRQLELEIAEVAFSIPSSMPVILSVDGQTSAERSSPFFTKRGLRTACKLANSAAEFTSLVFFHHILLGDEGYDEFIVPSAVDRHQTFCRLYNDVSWAIPYCVLTPGPYQPKFQPRSAIVFSALSMERACRADSGCPAVNLNAVLQRKLPANMENDQTKIEQSSLGVFELFDVKRSHPDSDWISHTQYFRTTDNSLLDANGEPIVVQCYAPQGENDVCDVRYEISSGLFVHYRFHVQMKNFSNTTSLRLRETQSLFESLRKQTEISSYSR